MVLVALVPLLQECSTEKNNFNYYKIKVAHSINNYHNRKKVFINLQYVHKAGVT